MKNWKIQRDPIYNKLCEKYGRNFIADAGFFEDDYQEELDLDYFLHFPVIPIKNIEDNYKAGKKNIILLYSGCFNPIHQGHIFSMNSSIERMQSLGYNVVNSYFTPAHDSYLSQKTDKVYDILRRSEFIYKIISENNLEKVCDVNVLPALLLKHDINFTEQMVFLKKYVQKYTNLDIPIYLVAGGDNSSFYKSFVEEDEYGCIVHNRPGSEDKFLASQREWADKFSDCKNIHFVNSLYEGSSTSVRQKKEFIEYQKKDLKLRISEQDYNDIRTEKLLTVFEKYYNNVYFLNVADQQVKFRDLPENMISLDSLLYKDYKFEVSRYYDLFGAKFVKFGARHKDSLLKQVSRLKEGPINRRFYLFDDDIHTGRTMQFAKDYLEKYGNIKINACISLNINNDNSKSEILDLRDFLIGNSWYNGLGVTTKHNKKLRVPYILPFINVLDRCSILEYKEFSREILEVNYMFYKDLKIKIKTLDNWTREFFVFIGIDTEQYIDDVLLRFIEDLS